MSRQSRATLLQELTLVNPWWKSPDWARRDAQLQAIGRAPFQRSPACLDTIAPPNLYTLRGPRRVGKSTLLKQTIARLLAEGIDPRCINYFPADLLTSATDVINLFQAGRALFPDLGDVPRYFLIDEATTIPEWQLGLKWLRDNTQTHDDCIVITGSSAHDIATGVVHLAGRRGDDAELDRLLLPMDFAEFVHHAGFSIPDPPRIALQELYADAGKQVCQHALLYLGELVPAFESYLQIGGFPRAVADYIAQGSISDGFLRDIWDVAQADLIAAGLTQPVQGLRLLERIAASLTAPLGLRTTAETLGVTHSTAGAWLNALAQSYLTFVLFQSSSGLPDLRRQRKVYPVDPVFARLPAHLLTGAREPTLSQLAELAIAMALFRVTEGHAVDHFTRPERLFYYRTSGGGEVDFVVHPGEYAVESKYVDSPSARETRAMAANFERGILVSRAAVDLQRAYPIIPAAIFCWLLGSSTATSNGPR